MKVLPKETKVDKDLLFAGIITASKYANTRAKAIYDTWAKEIPGDFQFFCSFNCTSKFTLPIVKLAGVDDRYPPQKKSFRMLYYMYQNYLNKYQWFLRSDDDVFIKPDRLGKFLKSLDPSKPMFIGQSSYERNHILSLGVFENYCMGGPGFVMSRAALKMLGPHLSSCIKNIYTTHEDVEISRCMRDHVKINCTWSQEVFINKNNQLTILTR